MSTAYTLITGATGFIGSHAAQKLLSGSRPVIAIVRGGRGYKNTAQLEAQGAVLVRGRFYDPTLLKGIFAKYSIRHVVHMAALTGIGKGGPKDYDRLNVRGTESLLSMSHRNRVDRFIFCSSVGVFGTIPDRLPADISTKVNPDNVYHQSKYIAEQRVFDFIDRGLNAYIVRPTITYGEGDSGFPATLIRMVRKRRLILPFRDNRIHLLSVRGLVEVVLKLLNLNGIPNRVFIAADEGPVVLQELVDWIHSFYCERAYPRVLKIPNGVFHSFKAICHLGRCPRMLGKIQRISEEWFFDTHKTDTLIGFRPLNTRKEFFKYLQALK